MKDWLCQSMYMTSNTLASILGATHQGVIDSLLTPEIKHQLEEGASRIIPAVVEKLDNSKKLYILLYRNGEIGIHARFRF